MKSLSKKVSGAVILSLLSVALGTAWAADKAPTPEDKLKEKVSERLEVAKEQAGTPQAQLEKRVDAVEDKLKKEPVKPIERMVSFDFSNAKAIQSSDGTLIFVGANGRYAIVGEIVDVWQKKSLKTAAEIEQSAKTIPVQALGVDPKTMNAFSIGEGSQAVTLFVDPLCGWCHELVKTVESNKTLQKDYRFNFYVVPALGDASNLIAKKLYCAGLDNAGKKDAFMAHGKTLPEGKVDPKCDLRGYDRTLLASEMMGVQAVPFVIAPDGRFSRGMPRDLARFLATPNKE